MVIFTKPNEAQAREKGMKEKGRRRRTRENGSFLNLLPS